MDFTDSLLSQVGSAGFVYILIRITSFYIKEKFRKQLFLLHQLPIMLLLLISCNGKESDKEGHFGEKNATEVSAEVKNTDKSNLAGSPYFVSNQISGNQPGSAKDTTTIPDDQRVNILVNQITSESKKLDTYNNQIPFFEKALLQHNENKEIRIKIGCELAESYLLKYLVEGNQSYYSKSYDTFVTALEEDTGLVYISEHFKVHTDTLTAFKEEWDNEKSRKGQEALLINSLINKFKSDVRKQN